MDHYGQLFELIADELNVQQVMLGSGMLVNHDGSKEPWKAFYEYDTLTKKGKGFKFIRNSKPVSAPRSLLAMASVFFESGGK